MAGIAEMTTRARAKARVILRAKDTADSFVSAMAGRLRRTACAKGLAEGRWLWRVFREYDRPRGIDTRREIPAPIGATDNSRWEARLSARTHRIADTHLNHPPSQAGWTYQCHLPNSPLITTSHL